jgi:hypothetical protein
MFLREVAIKKVITRWDFKPTAPNQNINANF